MATQAAARAAARSVRLVLMDVDGVMTDGGIFFMNEKGEARAFDAKDGIGIWLLRRAGILTGVISGRSSAAVRRRVQELGMEEIHLRVRDKLAVYREILRRRRLEDDSVCFIGDDVVDLGILSCAGLTAAPADAHPEVLKVVKFVTQSGGGHGAVREVADLILKAQKRMDLLLKAIRRGETR